MSAVVNETAPKAAGPVSGLIEEARRRDPLLFWVSVAHLLLVPLMLAAVPFDDRLVTGINPWIKPIKFTLANAVYMLTVGWLFYHLPASAGARRRISQLVALTITAETVLITLQAARGTTSHFNFSSVANAGVVGIMGLMIVVNTAAVSYAAFRFWRGETAVPAPYLWGIRLGLLIFLLASLEGFAMVRLHAHSVGVADGGPGLPLINWSTRGGDLRIAHFVGLHALQALPLVGYLFSSPRVAERIRNPANWVKAIGVLYAVVSLLLFLQALSGTPLIYR
ncbi:MAG TPA: hypothetical protein VK421_08915 [Pyrinomonadaceae bacterium]|nr:hypothetical protein [Pyrinomonadaceae bacterium]